MQESPPFSGIRRNAILLKMKIAVHPKEFKGKLATHRIRVGLLIPILCKPQIENSRVIPLVDKSSSICHRFTAIRLTYRPNG